MKVGEDGVSDGRPTRFMGYTIMQYVRHLIDLLAQNRRYRRFYRLGRDHSEPPFL
jgi:hypothetical protein